MRDALRRFTPLFIATLLGCGEAAPAPRHAAASASVAKPVASALPATTATLAPCAPPQDPSPTPAFITDRSAALDKLLAGDPHGATEALEKELATKPTDVAAYALRVAAQSTLTAASAEELKSLTHTRAFPIADYPTKYVLDGEAAFPGATASLELRIVTEDKAKYLSGDWFAEHGVVEPDAGDPTSTVQQLQGSFISKTLHFADHHVGVFGGALVAAIRDGTSAARAFDFQPAINQLTPGVDGMRPSVFFAQVVGKLMVVEFATSNSVGTITSGPLMAFDIDTGARKWTTGTGVATASSFVVAGRFAIVGEGTYVTGSAGSGTIRAIDLTNGKVVDKKPIGFLPLYIVRKDDRILVEGNGAGEAELAATSKLDAVTPSDLPPSVTPTKPSAEAVARTKCFLERAARAPRRARRQGRGGRDRRARRPDDRAASALHAAGRFLVDEAVHPDDAIDLTAKPPVTVETVPLGTRGTTSKLGPAPVLTQKESKSTAAPTAKIGEPPPPAPNPPRIDYAPSIPFQLPDDYAGTAMQRSYAGVTGEGASDKTVGNLAIFGTSDVVVLRGRHVQTILDVAPLLRLAPTEPAPGTIAHAAIRGDRVYLCVVGSAPVYNGSVFAIDVTTGKVAWRSDANTCSIRFVDLGDYLVTAHGPRGAGSKGVNQNALQALRADTGAVASTVALPSAPTELGFGTSSHVVVYTESAYITYAIGY